MKCEKCNGLGEIDNPRYWNASRMSDWYLHFPTMIKCRKCKGLGYIVTDMNEVVGELNEIYHELKYKNMPIAKRIENILSIIKKPESS